jgi:hypothetical protein
MDGDGDCRSTVINFCVAALAGWCHGPRSDSFFVEGESECTSERARGQSNIFGAVEEMFATDFQGLARIKNFLRGVAVSRMEGWRSDCRRAWGEKI